MSQTEAVDTPALAVAFGRALRETGLPTDPRADVNFARAMTLLAPVNSRDLYYAARAIFVSGPHQIAAFDRVFATVFGAVDPLMGFSETGAILEARAEHANADDELGDTQPQAGDAATITSTGESPDGEEQDSAQSPDRQDGATTLASAAERLQTQDFSALDDQELAAVHRLMRSLQLTPPMRRRRRTKRHLHRGRIDPRASMRRARGGDSADIVRRRRREEPRRLILLCDISGSMTPYARAYLQLMESAVVGAKAEAFTFATRLTRVTQQLRHHDPDAALRHATEAVPDWSGGTRIGEALRAFNDRYGRRGMARGATVVILSDGWELADTALLRREMEMLSRIAHRIVWVNPRSAVAGFAPVAGGMAVALPHCDGFVSGHSLAALDQVVDAIARDGRHF